MTITGDKRVCSTCGKEFVTYRHDTYSFKRTKRWKQLDGKWKAKVVYYCSYHCYHEGD